MANFLAKILTFQKTQLELRQGDTFVPVTVFMHYIELLICLILRDIPKPYLRVLYDIQHIHTMSQILNLENAEF